MLYLSIVNSVIALFAMFIIIVLILFMSQISFSFHTHSNLHNQVNVRIKTTLYSQQSGSINERKAQFFKIVEAGINDMYDQKDTQRIMRFCQFAKFELPLPEIVTNDSKRPYLYDPCEEYIDGLTAKPWWDSSDFEWAAPL